MADCRLGAGAQLRPSRSGIDRVDPRRDARRRSQSASAAQHQAELARRGHVAELFNRAVGQLDDEKLQIRLGAIYTLRQIAHDFPDLAGAVLELLNVYMRENAIDYGDADPPPDVEEIMRILASTRAEQ